MAERRSRDLAVGAMFALALIVLALTVMAVGGESRLFVKKAHYRVVFPSAEGLVVGSPVKMAGVQVGTVSEIRLSAAPEQSGIDVGIGVDRTFSGRVREDASAALRVLQMLSGEKFVEIIPGTAGSPLLAEGSEIRPSQDPEFLQQAAVAAENLNDITVSLKRVLEALESGEGLMGQMITDPEFGKQGLEDLAATVKNLETLSGDLLRGRSGSPGMVGRLLYDQSFAARLDDVGRALEHLSVMIESIDLNEGALAELLAEDGAGKQAIQDLRDAAGSLRRVGERLESNEGLIGRLLNDTGYSEALAADLRTTVGNLAEISEKINRGQGTLGALINERAVHDGIENLATGVEDDKFMQWLLRRSRKKGIKAAEKTERE